MTSCKVVQERKMTFSLTNGRGHNKRGKRQIFLEKIREKTYRTPIYIYIFTFFIRPVYRFIGFDAISRPSRFYVTENRGIDSGYSTDTFKNAVVFIGFILGVRSIFRSFF